MQKQVWVILTESRDGGASPGRGYGRVSLSVSFVHSLIFKKNILFEREWEQKRWLRGMWGGRRGTSRHRADCRNRGPAGSQDTEIMTWAGQTRDALSHTGVLGGSLSKEEGLVPLPLQGLEKDEESMKTGSGGGRKEQWRCPFRASLVPVCP